ncbi:putative arsenite efflux transporter ArsB-like protein [Lasiosphaeria ovina]|uniref:Arsenite efflux transporter ArsB-like protein n=1 Tax=Lasiosphaeria ovina TaxID=92902 RepID=A0AAE0KCY9_9PEZI|nr:putative arsenite efflux transporter ArsB-like protein [Lasiosphaeria ovina]
MPDTQEKGDIKDWRSIVTLIVFVATNIIVISPFHIPVYLPRWLSNAFLDFLSWMRIIAPRPDRRPGHELDLEKPRSRFVRLRFPVNFVTAPLIADLFLLAILAIGRQEVADGTIGADNIFPIDIMAFFITLAYIAISIDASGLIRYLAFRVLQWGGKNGNRLFFYLYSFFFVLGSFIGNDPIILSGTAFLAYMTRVSSNIIHPRAWIFTQFAVANIASAILVSSNPTNLVLAGAFGIRFIDYTANMIVPVVATAIILFPFLLYIIFASEDLIPISIKMHELPENLRAKKPVNPNIPHARGTAEEEENHHANGEHGNLLSLEEIMNPFLDKGGAWFGAAIMAATLVTLLALNAASTEIGSHPVFYVTVPAAFVMLCWDIGSGWMKRHETREIARKGRREVEEARRERALKEREAARLALLGAEKTGSADKGQAPTDSSPQDKIVAAGGATTGDEITSEKKEPPSRSSQDDPKKSPPVDLSSSTELDEAGRDLALEKGVGAQKPDERATLVSVVAHAYRWSQETFPTVTAVVTHLPFALVPFAFSMFVLVQALVTKGWVEVFAHGWDHWVDKTGTVGAIGGMGFLSVVICNFTGTNIGASILLSRVIQAWQAIHAENLIPISNRTFWATVYAMALGVNYGAFSTTFSASLAGLLWRDILGRKHIHVRGVDFARENLPIIALAMTIGCVVLIGEVYIMRDELPVNLSI